MADWRGAESLLPSRRPKGLSEGCGSPRRPGTARSTGRGDPLRMTVKAIRTAGPAVWAKRFGALEGGAPFVRESESHPGERAPGRKVKFLRGRWDVGPPTLANAGNGVRSNCPAAKASHISEASAVERESVAMGDRRRIGFAKAKTDPIRGRRRAISGRCAISGNGVARASSQRWATPGSKSGNGVGIKDARADCGLRRNRSPKTRKGRGRNLEPGRMTSPGRSDGTGT
jgi:hypothetical protein